MVKRGCTPTPSKTLDPPFVMQRIIKFASIECYKTFSQYNTIWKRSSVVRNCPSISKRCRAWIVVDLHVMQIADQWPILRTRTQSIKISSLYSYRIEKNISHTFSTKQTRYQSTPSCLYIYVPSHTRKWPKIWRLWRKRQNSNQKVEQSNDTKISSIMELYDNKLEPQGTLIAHLNTKSTSVISCIQG